MRKGDIIVVYDKNSLLSQIIGCLTEDRHGKWSHVAVAISEDKVVEAMPEGVIITEKSTFFNRYSKCSVLRGSSIIDVDEFVKDVKAQVGIKYGWIQLFLDLIAICINKIFSTDIRKIIKYDLTPKVTCTEVVGKALMRQKITINGIFPSYLEPDDFFKTDFLVKVESRC